jgi:hypothetical protein
MKSNRLLISALLAVSSTLPCHAQAPSWVSLLSKATPGSFAPLPACEMTFDAGWKDIAKAGQVKVTVVPAGDTIKVLAKGADVGAAAALLPIEGEYAGVIDAATLLPKAMEQTEKRKGSVLISAVDFSGGKVTANKTLKPASGEEIKVTKENVVAPAFDLVSAALFIRSQPLKEVGESYVLAIAPQSSPKPLTITVVERGKYTYNGNSVDAIKLELKQTPFKPTKEEADKEVAAAKGGSLSDKTKEAFKGHVSSLSAWISDDDKRLPLEISVDIAPIGAVGAKLVEFKQN